MKLNIQNRIVLLGLLPVTGDINSLKQLRVLREELAFSDKESKALKIQNSPSGNVVWNNDHKVKDKEIEIGETLTGVIRGLLEDLDKDKKLHDNHVDLWDLFCG
jgi:hypothetical protein